MADLQPPPGGRTLPAYPLAALAPTRGAWAGTGPAMTPRVLLRLRGTFEFFQIIDICLTLSVPWYADKLASKRSGWNAQGLR